MTKDLLGILGTPLYVMAKPAGAACNMQCKYCYYLEKKDFYPDDKRTYMSDHVLETYIRKYIEAQPSGQVLFTWHGGEATLRPLSFYQKAIELQNTYAGGRLIANSLQTNGLLLNDEWCQFLRKNNWLVGLSIDGPQDFHDEYRRDAGNKPSFQRVMRAVNLLNKHGVDWNAMAVVNDYNAEYPEEFYDFFKSINCNYIQFTPIVERVANRRLLSGQEQGGTLTPYSVTPEQWGNFLIRVFDRWVVSDVGTVFVQIFDATLANYVGVEPGICTLSGRCGHAAVMEYNGDVYCCDHYVFPQYKLGNIAADSLINMFMSDKQQQFATAKLGTLPTQCRQCRWLNLCHGECPKNRFAHTADGEEGLNYLCKGYQMFFEHAEPYFEFMANELKAERPPSNVMAFARKNLL